MQNTIVRKGYTNSGIFYMIYNFSVFKNYMNLLNNDNNDDDVIFYRIGKWTSDS